MKFTEYKHSLHKKLLPRTVTFLIKGNQVCLGLKERGFGKGYYLGIGGKVEEDDRSHVDEDEFMTIKNAACREVLEEIDVEVLPKDLEYRGRLSFYFPHIEDESWNQEVHVFIATRWEGEPQAKRDNSGQIEITPQWINKNEIPFDHMWDDAHYWLPQTLEGKRVEGEFLFDKDLQVIDHSMKFIER